MTSPPRIPQGLDRLRAILQLPSRVDDPVRIIGAAQVQLRRWRRSAAATPTLHWQDRVGEIIAAREALLRRTLDVTSSYEGVDSSHGAVGPTPRR